MDVLRRRRRWFSVDSKSFEFVVEGEGSKSKVFITERHRDRVSWIRFGEEGIKILLKGVELFRREACKKNRGLDWKENGRRYNMEYKENDVGHFADGKRHRLFIHEENGLLNGWTLLAEALQNVEVKASIEEKRKPGETISQSKEEIYRGGRIKYQSFVEITNVF